MPSPGHCWRHIILHTKSSWLPGDPRGWRSRDHKRHSSGDYKNPPPEGEHQELHRYCEENSAEAVKISHGVRPKLGPALVEQFQKHGVRILALSLSAFHAHALTEMADDMRVVKEMVGKCKGASSHAVRDVLPGTIWAESGDFKAVRDRGHHENVYKYILYEQGPSAWTWSFRDPTMDGVFDRQRPGPEGPA